MAARKKISQTAENKTETNNSNKQQELSSGFEEFSKKITGPSFAGGVKHFTKHDIMQLELHQLRVVSSLRDVNLKEIEIHKFTLEAQQKISQLNKELEELKTSCAQKVENLNRFNEELERAYKISLKSITYDDADGKIFEHFHINKEENVQK